MFRRHLTLAVCFALAAVAPAAFALDAAAHPIALEHLMAKKTAAESTVSTAPDATAQAADTGSQLPGGAEATSAAGAADTASATAAVDSGALAGADTPAGALGEATSSAELNTTQAPTPGDLDAAMRAMVQAGDELAPKRYRVVSPLEHDQKRYDIGAPVQLSDDQAKPLLGHTVVLATDD